MSFVAPLNLLMPNFIRCLIVEGEEELRGQLSKRLAAYPKIQVIGAVSTVAAAILQCREMVPDVLFLDNTLVDIDELATERVPKTGPGEVLVFGLV